jgi:acyl-coenzyme A synthetase/AMP-(fatty) acid ligase
MRPYSTRYLADMTVDTYLQKIEDVLYTKGVGFHVDTIATEVPMAYVVAKKVVAQNEATAKDLIGWHSTRTASHKHLRCGISWVGEISKGTLGKILRRILKTVSTSSEGPKSMGAVEYTGQPTHKLLTIETYIVRHGTPELQ